MDALHFLYPHIEWTEKRLLKFFFVLILLGAHLGCAMSCNESVSLIGALQ
jgi:hypothetical protein